MTLDIKNKIKVILSMDDLLLPSSTIDRDKIFFQLYKDHREFLGELEFRINFDDYHESDVLDTIIINFHNNLLLEMVREKETFYKIIDLFKKRFLERFSTEIDENKGTFDEIEREYKMIFNEIYPNVSRG